MVAFVDDHVAVIRHDVGDHALADETLHDADIDPPSRSTSASAESTDRLGRYIEERRKALDPLIEQLTSMHQHERVDAALRDEPRGNDGLAKCRRRRQDACLVAQDGIGSGFLFRAQLALKRNLQRAAVVAFVANAHADAKLGEQLAYVIEAAPW